MDQRENHRLTPGAKRRDFIDLEDVAPDGEGFIDALRASKEEVQELMVVGCQDLIQDLRDSRDDIKAFGARMRELGRFCLIELNEARVKGPRGHFVRAAGAGLTFVGIFSAAVFPPVTLMAEALIPENKRGLLHVGLIGGGAVCMVVGGHLFAVGQYMVDGDNRKPPPLPSVSRSID